jgi:AGCS family alanine or glycine:cation symporter
VIIVSTLGGGDALAYSGDPMMMVIKAYSGVLGSWAEYYLAISVLLFAFATIVCWAHYGRESLGYLTKRRSVATGYLVVFCAAVFVGSVSAPSWAWLFADLALGVMTIMNLSVLIPQFPEVKSETDNFFESNKKTQQRKPR